jgi:hypothetical protein
MIKVKGYENYLFCPKTCEVYSVRSEKLKKLNPLSNRGNRIIYALYLNGNRVIVSKFEIIKKCIHEIEKLKMH